MMKWRLILCDDYCNEGISKDDDHDDDDHFNELEVDQT